MEKIFGWKVTPAAGRMTINGVNEAGAAVKVTNIVEIAPLVRRRFLASEVLVIATHANGRTYQLA